MDIKSKKNNRIVFPLLIVLVLPLVLLMSYYSTSVLGTLFHKTEELQKPVSISEIERPSYTLNAIIIDTDLPKFPIDYDNLVKTLNLSLTQHQKTTLLLYGESISKSNHTNITDAYKELIEKDIPILIPQKYINEYLNNRFDEYKLQLESVPKEIEENINVEKLYFSNPYEEYIQNQLIAQIPNSTNEDQEDIKSYPNLKDFIIDCDSQSINQAYYIQRVLSVLIKNSSMSDITEMLNNIVIDSQSSDINTRNKLSVQLKHIVFNNSLNMDGDVYWKVSVISGTSYIYPMYISQEYVVNDSNFNEGYDVEPLAQSKNSVRVPILMYHRIEPLPTNTSSFTTGLYVSPEMFEQQLAYMVKKNYKSLTSQEFYNILLSGKNPTQKSVMITFDDGTKGQYTTGYTLLKKYGLVGVFYIPSSKTSITYNQLKEMSQNGMIIESHSATHIDLAKETNPTRLYSEIVGSRYALINATGQNVITISYPGCVADKEAYSYVSQAGYLLGASCGRGIDHYYSKRLSLQRVHVFDSFDNLKNILSGKP